MTEYYFLFSGSLMQKLVAERVWVDHNHQIMNIQIGLDLSYYESVRNNGR
jgi:hypothetical protein